MTKTARKIAIIVSLSISPSPQPKVISKSTREIDGNKIFPRGTDIRVKARDCEILKRKKHQEVSVARVDDRNCARNEFLHFLLLVSELFSNRRIKSTSARDKD